MSKPQRDVECFRNLAHGHAALGLTADHSGPRIPREGYNGKSVLKVSMRGVVGDSRHGATSSSGPPESGTTSIQTWEEKISLIFICIGC